MIPLGTWVETGTVLSEHRCTVGLAFWKSAFYFSVNCLTSVVMTVLLWTIYPGFFQKNHRFHHHQELGFEKSVTVSKVPDTAAF